VAANWPWCDPGIFKNFEGWDSVLRQVNLPAKVSILIGDSYWARRRTVLFALNGADRRASRLPTGFFPPKKKDQSQNRKTLVVSWFDYLAGPALGWVLSGRDFF